VAILLLTVVIKLLLYPLAHKSMVSMARMKFLMPKVEEIKARYGNDKMKMNQEMMALYKREKVNPVAGCLPILLQIPVFFALYRVLFVTIEMRQAPFFGWIHDLSVPDPANLFTAFGYLPWDAPSFLNLGVWPIVMCITMFIQQRISPKPADPVQAAVMTYMPFVFLFLFASFPAGLVIYWAWNNTLTIVQQLYINTHLTKKGLR
jgi:YidC/Oxa1 family membrane protein insertase